MEHIKPYKAIKSKWQTIFIGFIVLLFFGFMLDLLSGFSILRNSKNIYSGIVGILLLALFYSIGEAGATWIGSRDKESDPLYKRAFHLSLLLAYGGFVIAALWLFFKYSGLMKI